MWAAASPAAAPRPASAHARRFIMSPVPKTRRQHGNRQALRRASGGPPWCLRRTSPAPHALRAPTRPRACSQGPRTQTRGRPDSPLGGGTHNLSSQARSVCGSHCWRLGARHPAGLDRAQGSARAPSNSAKTEIFMLAAGCQIEVQCGWGGSSRRAAAAAGTSANTCARILLRLLFTTSL